MKRRARGSGPGPCVLPSPFLRGDVSSSVPFPCVTTGAGSVTGESGPIKIKKRDVSSPDTPSKSLVRSLWTVYLTSVDDYDGVGVRSSSPASPRRRSRVGVWSRSLERCPSLGGPWRPRLRRVTSPGRNGTRTTYGSSFSAVEEQRNRTVYHPRTSTVKDTTWEIGVVEVLRVEVTDTDVIYSSTSRDTIQGVKYLLR